MSTHTAQRGIDFLEAIRDGIQPPAPIQDLIGFDLVEIGDGTAVFRFEPGEQHLNPLGLVHGGIAGLLLDSAMGAAVHSTLPVGTGYGTLETSFRLVRGITPESGSVFAEGHVVHRGGRVATARGQVLRERDGKLLAHGESTCLLLAGAGGVR